MLLEGGTDTVIEELRACVGTGSNKRLDIASLLANRFINYTIFHAENSSLDDKIISRIVELIKADDVFTDDLRYVIVKRFINSTSKQKFQKILIDKTVQELAMR